MRDIINYSNPNPEKNERNQKMGKYNPAPYQLDLNYYPHLVTKTIPGPKSNELHGRAKQ